MTISTYDLLVGSGTELRVHLPEPVDAALDTWSLPQLLRELARVEDALRQHGDARTLTASLHRDRLQVRADELVEQIRSR